jgi:hypothetical protein
MLRVGATEEEEEEEEEEEPVALTLLTSGATTVDNPEPLARTSDYHRISA